MKREERLLRALGNVKDSFVLEVSQYMDDPRKEVLVKPKNKRKGIAGLAAAAAAALVLTGTLSLYSTRVNQPVEVRPAPSLSSTVQEWKHEQWPAFQIEYDHNLLDMVEGIGGVFLYPIEYPDDLPVCEIKIEFLPGLLPYAAVEKSRAEMTDELVTVHQDQELGTYSFHISSNQASWAAVEKDVWIYGAGSYGSYRLTSQYFVEATEGWGSTFARICDSFTCPLSESPNPEAEKAIMDFAEGYFSGNRITMLANYYGDSQDLRDVYPQDASRVQIVSLQGLEGLDEWAHVSLTFLETEESDSYTYLSMEVMKTQAGYRVSFYGLEK